MYKPMENVKIVYFHQWRVWNLTFTIKNSIKFDFSILKHSEASKSQFNTDKAWNGMFKPMENVKIVF